MRNYTQNAACIHYKVQTTHSPQNTNQWININNRIISWLKCTMRNTKYQHNHHRRFCGQSNPSDTIANTTGNRIHQSMTMIFELLFHLYFQLVKSLLFHDYLVFECMLVMFEIETNKKPANSLSSLFLNEFFVVSNFLQFLLFRFYVVLLLYSIVSPLFL